MTLALDLGRAGSRLQLKPGVVASNWHLLQREDRYRSRVEASGLPGSDGGSTLTFKGMLMQPRKSSAFSSEPDDADPLARTDLAICLKYLVEHRFVFYNQTFQEMKLTPFWFFTFPSREAH